MAETKRKVGLHNRSPIPRALWMAISHDLNRGPSPFELELERAEEEARRTMREQIKAESGRLLRGTGVAA
ncbi:MAG: hypothetical protein WAV09_03225 [Minisyncoccia bacterium]